MYGNSALASNSQGNLGDSKNFGISNAAGTQSLRSIYDRLLSVVQLEIRV